MLISCEHVSGRDARIHRKFTRIRDDNGLCRSEGKTDVGRHLQTIYGRNILGLVGT